MSINNIKLEFEFVNSLIEISDSLISYIIGKPKDVVFIGITNFVDFPKKTAEELEEIKLYDNLKLKNDEVISFDQAIEEIEKSRK